MKIVNRTATLDKKGLRRNSPGYIILHGTHSYPNFEDLLKFHKSKGWNGVGYHLFVDKEGKVFQGRPYSLEGAHTIGYNTSSIAIGIYEPQEGLTESRVTLIKDLISQVKIKHPTVQIISHTQAQFGYINEKLKEEGIKMTFPNSRDVNNPQNFNNARKRASRLLKKIKIQENKSLHDVLSGLKNCPGPIYCEIE